MAKNDYFEEMEMEMENKSSLDIKEILNICLDKWKWFLLSIVVCLSLGILHLKRTAPQYSRNATVHIKEEGRGRSMAKVGEQFSQLGLTNSSSSVENEVVAFNAPEIAEKVAKRLGLEVMAYHPGTFRDALLYGKTMPVKVSFADMKDEDSGLMRITMLPEGKVRITKVKKGQEEQELNLVTEYGKEVKTALGKVVVTKSPYYAAPKEEYDITVYKFDIYTAGQIVRGKLLASQNSKMNSIIDISCTDESAERAEDMINALINEYNRKWIDDKNQVSVLTSKFIDERIEVIQKELGTVDNKISDYRSSNLIIDPHATSSLYINQIEKNSEESMALNNQISMCQYLREYVANKANEKQLIPANIGITSADITRYIGEYNTQMLKRNTYVKNSSEKNPMVENIDEELKAQRMTILQSIDNELTAMRKTLNTAQRTASVGTSKLSSEPTHQKNLLSMDRQQKIKESLYLYLLQKREENELSQAFNAYNTRIISMPRGPKGPTAPKSMSIMLIALAIGIAIPIVIIIILEYLHTTVRGRKDMEDMAVPMAGEIPNVGKASELKTMLRKLRKNKDVDNALNIVVKHGNRNVINEAFRILRSNLSFMIHPADSDKKQVILITSANPGSGKTFTTTNLAFAFAMQEGTKVAVVDLDIRKASLSKHFGNADRGVTDYLGGLHNDWRSLILHASEDGKVTDRDITNKRVDIIPVGTIPPNPAELLQSPRLKEMLEEMKTEYDIIFLDMPPAEVVADVSIVKHLAQLTLYVVRAGLLERSLLPEIDKYYKEKRFNNLAIILNGTEMNSRRKGYGYGYGYGYGSAYGDAYNNA